MERLVRTNFSEIVTDYQFFEENSHESLELQLKYKSIINDIEEQKPIKKMLDFGCGDGSFLRSLIANKSFLKVRNIGLDLVELDINHKVQAAKQLSQYFDREIRWISHDLKELDTGYNVILANHMRYYVDNLKVKIVKLVQSLDYGGKLVLTLSRFDHPLANLLDVLAQHKGMPIPFNSAMQLFQVLYEYGFYYDTIDVHSTLRFKNNDENKNKIVSFLLAGNENLYSEPIVSNFFDIHTFKEEVVIPLRDQIIVVHA